MHREHRGRATAEPAPAGPSLLLLALGTALLVLLVTLPSVASDPGLVRHGPRDEKAVALTFDIDMTPDRRREVLAGQARHFDRRIVDLLRRTDTPATIFMTGLFARVYPDTVRSLARDQLFEIANHSYSHLAFRSPCFWLPAAATKAERARQIVRGRAALRSVTGVTTRWFRFPGGCHSRADVQLARRLGQVPVQWDVVSGDAYQPDPDVVIRTVLSRVRPGSIVVMHLSGRPSAPATYDALKRIIPALRARGYRPELLSDLLGRPGTAPEGPAAPGSCQPAGPGDARADSPGPSPDPAVSPGASLSPRPGAFPAVIPSASPSAAPTVVPLPTCSPDEEET